MEEKTISEKEGLELISTMLGKAKNSYYDTGISAMMWGAVVAFCSLVKFTELELDYRLPFDIYWLTVAAIIPQVIISIREKKDRKVKAYDEVYMDYIWLGFGVSLVLMIFVVNGMGYAWQPVAEEYLKATGNRSSFQVYEFVGPLFLILYGIPTFTTGAACKFRPMLWGGLLCWACCIAAVFTSAAIDLLLIAFAAIFAWLIPGIIMKREYKQAKKELEQEHV